MKICQTTQLLFIFFPILFEGSLGLKIVKLDVPSNALNGSDVRLICDYELNERERLYAIKWYLNHSEFYRYVPDETPVKKQSFPLLGVKIDLNESDNGTVLLKKVSPLASGRYSCEVSTDLTFQTVAEEKEMTITNKSSIVGKTIFSLSVTSPGTYRVGDDVRISYEYQFANSEPYTVKWYFNDNEIFRLTSNETMEKQVFFSPDIEVDFNRSDNHSLFLKNIRCSGNGYYKCEFSSRSIVSAHIVEMKVIGSTGSNFIETVVPKTAKVGDDVILRCNYSLGAETSYAVKWFYNSNEFYRYEQKNNSTYKMNPAMNPPVINVDLDRSENTYVLLKNLVSEASGFYKCQIISKETCLFKETEMVVNESPLIPSAPIGNGSVSFIRVNFVVLLLFALMSIMYWFQCIL